MRVLYLNPAAAIGGAGRSLRELVSGVDRRERVVSALGVERRVVEAEAVCGDLAA